MVILDGIKLEKTTLERERVRVAPIIERMVETKLRWFDHVEISLVDAVIRRVDRMEDSQTIRGRGRHVDAVTHSFFTFFFLPRHHVHRQA